MLLEGHITPTWDIKEFYDLEYTLGYHKEDKLNQRYVAAGHVKDSMSLYNCFENSLKVDTQSIRDQFDFLKDLALAVNLFKPGQYLPMHHDLYGKYKSVFSVDSSDKIIRVMVMLENSVPGQILQINHRAIAKWSAGDWFGWQGQEPHAFYNLSMSNRYAIQITGHL
jgi:hypothetical protein